MVDPPDQLPVGGLGGQAGVVELCQLRTTVAADAEDVYKRQGLRQNYNVNISGGIGKTKYYWSLGYTDNQGYIKGDEYKTIRSRINADTKVAEFLTVGINAQFSNKDESNEAIKLSNISRQSPLGQPYDENGELKWYPHDDSGIEQNPVSYTHLD